MAFDRFLIAPFNTGLQTDLRPFLILDDAFTELENAYVFRGRVRKRWGATLMIPADGTSTPVLASRLRVLVATTDSSGDASGTVPDDSGLVGQLFSIGTEIFTVNALGTPAVLKTTGSSTTHTFNTSNGAFVFTGAAVLTPVYWYPAFPVMGITQYESGAVNNHPTFAFDTHYAYTYTGSGWARSGTAFWEGNDLNFFWTTNWQGTPGGPILFVTNFNATVPTPEMTDDPMWYYNGTSWTSIDGVDGFYFLPNPTDPLYTGGFIQTARIIVPFKNRLVLLNTIENDGSEESGVNTAYVNRCRYSWYGSPFAVNAWYEPNTIDINGNVGAGAGFVDATTEEQIISAEFIKDRLIVYFERSTWELVYTGNEVLPFVWQKINTELGSQSTFSTVPFDKQILTVGNTGIHACNGANVERIDNKIPDDIFDQFETSNNSTLRTSGIRDFYTELVYWTFVETTSTVTQTYPNQLLVYNYKNGAWALFDDCITTFGYFEQQTDATWADTYETWDNIEGTWTDNINDANQRQVLAGTPEGFIFVIATAENRNAPSMQITDITYNNNGTITLTIINHNFSLDDSEGSVEEADYILIENVVADSATMTALNGNIFAVNYLTVNTIFITVNLTGNSSTYKGGGTGTRVSNIQIETKQINPYMQDDRNVYLHKIDFGVEKTSYGQITVDYYPSSTSVSMIQAGQASTAIMGNSVLETFAYDPFYYPLETYQDRLWHPVYFQTSGNCIQLYLYMTPAQMTNPKISLEAFELDGMILYTQATASRMQ